MDINRFQNLLNDPAKTLEDLLIMHKNAKHSEVPEFIRLSENALTERFPLWNNAKSQRNRGTPVDVMFQGKHRHFDTQKEGYIWLIERFIQHYPKPFLELNWETYFFAAGPRTLYFAKSAAKLFGDNAQLAEDKNNFHRLTNGWYAKLVLRETQKFTCEVCGNCSVEVLRRLELGGSPSRASEGGYRQHLA